MGAARVMSRSRNRTYAGSGRNPASAFPSAGESGKRGSGEREGAQSAVGRRRIVNSMTRPAIAASSRPASYSSFGIPTKPVARPDACLFGRQRVSLAKEAVARRRSRSLRLRTGARLRAALQPPRYVAWRLAHFILAMAAAGTAGKIAVIHGTHPSPRITAFSGAGESARDEFRKRGRLFWAERGGEADRRSPLPGPGWRPKRASRAATLVDQSSRACARRRPTSGPAAMPRLRRSAPENGNGGMALAKRESSATLAFPTPPTRSQARSARFPRRDRAPAAQSPASPRRRSYATRGHAAVR